MKKRSFLFILIGLALICVLIFFGLKYLGNMSYDKLSEIVKRDTVLFSTKEIPDKVLDKLSENKIVVVGEYHNIKEHQTFLFQLSTQLNEKHGYQKLLVETPQAFSWIFEDYSTGVLPEANESIKKRFWLYIGEQSSIRAYNLERPEEDRIRVYTIDINHTPFNFILSVEYMQNFVIDPEPLKAFCLDLKENVQNEEKYINKVIAFQKKILEDRETLVSLLGEKWVNRLDYMIEIELKSAVCRDYLKQGNSKKRMLEREKIIKGIVDNHLKDTDVKILINVGSAHAQKHSYRGTKMEWLSEYLTYHSPYAKGNTYSLLVMPAKGTVENIADPVDLSRFPFKNELFRVISEFAGQSRAYLSFDDESFSKEKTLLNFHHDNRALRPKKQYDGVVIMPEGTYINPMAN